MNAKKSMLHRLLIKIENLVDRIRGLRSNPTEKLIIENYHGYQNHEKIVLRGRVMTEKRPWLFRESDSGWRNVRGGLRYWLTGERGGIPVEGEIAGKVFRAVSDEEGYFVVVVSHSSILQTSSRWSSYVTWISGNERRFAGSVQSPGVDAVRMIVSDVDDTVLKTGAQRRLQMIRTTLLKNHHTREVFPGVGRLYEGLVGNAGNPLYYVTSSPWNLHAFMIQLFKLREIPFGPAFMTDWGVDESKFLKHSHGKHKSEAIHHLLDFHPDLPCILIGDSGEKDPEIFRTVVERYPDRIEAIYIRDMSGGIHGEAVRELESCCNRLRVHLLLMKDSAEAEADSRQQGYLE